jgi:hypothetical protein
MTTGKDEEIGIENDAFSCQGRPTDFSNESEIAALICSNFDRPNGVYVVDILIGVFQDTISSQYDLKVLTTKKE